METVSAVPTGYVSWRLTRNPWLARFWKKVDDSQMGVVLKRMMVRARRQKVAERYGVQALVTGEALGQGLQPDADQPASDRQRLGYPDSASLISR